MKQYSRLLAVVLGPGFISGAALTSYTAFQSFALGNCDMKFGCVGGVQLVAALAATSFALSALGLVLPVALFRSIVRALPKGWLVLVVLFLACCLLAMLFTIGHWPFEPFAPLVTAWAVASAALGLVVLFLAHRLAPNNSFKPTPLRGAA